MMPRRRVYPDDVARRQAQNQYRQQGRSQHELRFTGVDGEGTGDGRDHRYVLLGVGDSQITNENGLGFCEIMEFLYSEFLLAPDNVFAGFFLGYDFAQWLRGLPEGRARMLLTDWGIAKRARSRSGSNRTPFPVRYEGWEFDILGMKRFKLKPEDARSWMYICDAGPFFQTSLVKAIDPANWADPIVTDQEFSLVLAGKENRSKASLGPDMRRYNALENEILSRLLVRTNEGFVKAGIRLKRDQWFGPGQAAQQWLRHVKCPTREDLGDKNAFYLDLGRRAYYGGWFEIFAHGIVPGRTYEYDINSAYPFIASRLPCFLHGNWRNNARLGSAGYQLVFATVTGTDKHIGAMLHRLPDGSIRRPHHTKGWYWWTELDAAKRAGIIDRIECHESWLYEPCNCLPSLRGLVGLYDERLRVGKKTSAGKSFKLLYNSAYGKFAQSVGNPKYGNALYASLITSGCRTMILDVIATHPRKTDAVVMVATDGVYFTEPHPSLVLSERIGEWDVSEKENLCLFKPGVYWDDVARDRIGTGGPVSFKARGINAKQFASAITTIDNHYKGWGQVYPKERDPMGDRTAWHPRVTFSTDFAMVTPGQALEWGRWADCGTLGHSEPHPSGCMGCNGSHLVQDSDPIGKRHSGWFDETRGIYWSTPYPDGGHIIESTPYDKSFGQPDPYELGLTPDGSVIETFSWILHG